MKKLKITKVAAKHWETLDAKQYRQVGKSMFGLLENSRPQDSQSLKGAKHGERRVDVGEYRIIYREEADTIEILVVGKRDGDEAYKLWKQITK
jgi:mRNA interferase RelE/StbE